MKRSMCILSGVLCLLFASCQTAQDEAADAALPDGTVSAAASLDDMETGELPSDETVSAAASLDDTETGELPSDEEAQLWDGDMPEYVKVYTEFLLYGDLDSDSGFPIRGYYLFDLNFDDIPELGILHDSLGSMGGYFTLYYYDGNGISRILNDRGEPVQISNYTQILADDEQQKVWLLKEMWLLMGNDNGTYGYVSEIRSEGQVPCVYDILNLYVDQGSAADRIRAGNHGSDHDNEDGYLLDDELAECLVAQYCPDGEWNPISTSEYWELKRDLIPEENSFVDLRLNEDLQYFREVKYEDGDESFYLDVKMETEEIERLFSNFVQ